MRTATLLEYFTFAKVYFIMQGLVQQVLLPRVLANQVIILLPCMLALQASGLAFAGQEHLPLWRFVGSLIEFYDFNIYGTAAALVFGKVFFPALGPAAATVAALATLGVGIGQADVWVNGIRCDGAVLVN